MAYFYQTLACGHVKRSTQKISVGDNRYCVTCGVLCKVVRIVKPVTQKRKLRDPDQLMFELDDPPPF